MGSFALSSESQKDLDRYLKHVPRKEAALLYALHLVQKEKGYVTEDSIDYLCSTLETSRAHIEGVLSFYTMYFRQPMGEKVISVCSTLSCALGGASKLVKHLESRLGIQTGETTPDGKFSLLKVECLAACDRAPVLMVNDSLHGKVTPAAADELLKK